MTLEEFLDRVTPGRERVVLDIEVPGGADETSPFIVLRYGTDVIVVNPMGLPSHLCVDLHPFVDGQAAAVGVMGMTEGRRYRLDDVGRTSHGWPAVAQLSAILGEQAGAPVEGG